MSARTGFIGGIMGIAALIAAWSVDAQHMQAANLRAEWRVEDIAARGIPDGAEITIDFAADGRIAGRGGCNRYNGAYRLQGTALTIGPLAMTRMACVPALMEVEQRFASALAQVGAARIDDSGALILSDATGAAVITARRVQSN